MRFLGWFLALLVVAAIGLRTLSRSFLFRADATASGMAPSDFVDHDIVGRDGTRVHALELPAPLGARTVVLFHNNRETAEMQAGLARSLRERGFGVLLVEYRGYGASRGGAPTEEGLYLDAEAALDMLSRRGVGPDRIVLWGTSLGTGVAAEMARRARGARLVLVTPYTSIPDIVKNSVPFFPAALVMPDHFDTLAKSKQIRIPTLVIHGDTDEIVPFWMGERITKAIRGARLVRIAGAHHGDIFAREGSRLLDEISSFGI